MRKVLALAATLGLMTAAGAANAAVIFSDGFETPVNTHAWQVYRPSFGDWTVTAGAGIEIQTSGVVVNAHGGNQYVELDSDNCCGGHPTRTTNSAMTRTLLLGAGDYELEWYYRPRTDNTGNDNRINVFLDGSADPLRTNRIAFSNGRTSTISDWIQETVAFSLAGEDLYRLTFAAAGTANALGGFLDDITLRRTDVPEPASLALLGVGLLGLFAARRHA